MKDYAPVALFVHSRLDHTQQTVAALQQNALAEKTLLYVYSDGPRESRQGEEEAVKEVRAYLATITGFLSVNIIERPNNWGLKRNIIEGLNNVTAEHDSVIVVEDDCVTCPGFLNYMNVALKKYEADKSIWHLAGWSPGLSSDCEFYRSSFMSCWGWATWEDRWRELNLDAWSLMSKMNLMDRYRFNLNNAFPFYSHLVGNYLGINNTWAIFWSATIFIGGGKCINPAVSKVKNVGMDGSGSHDVRMFDQKDFIKTDLNLREECLNSNSLERQLRVKLALHLSLKEKISMWLKMLIPTAIYGLCIRHENGR